MNNTKVIFISSVVTFLATSAIWIAGIVFYIVDFTYYFAGFMDSASFSVEVEAPHKVKMEEIFNLTVSVTNPSEETITLDSIDIYDSLLDGFEIISIEPEPDDVLHLFGFYSIYLYYKLAPGENVVVTCTLKAREPGLWIGDIDSCTPGQQFVTVSKGILVEQ